MGKWSVLDIFIATLNATYPDHIFERGSQDKYGQPHNDWLSTQSDLILNLLQQPDSLVFLDVRMDSEEHRRAASHLWRKATAVGLGESDWQTVDVAKDITTKLAGAIITLARLGSAPTDFANLISAGKYAADSGVSKPKSAAK